jgi:hypothetical protein
VPLLLQREITVTQGTTIRSNETNDDDENVGLDSGDDGDIWTDIVIAVIIVWETEWLLGW